MTKEQIKVSIITVNLNNAAGLKKTIESVKAQRFRDVEFLVIDGGSSDGSVGQLDEYKAEIDYWVSEPDRGVYAAMNKGIRLAKGEYCYFLNSGDYLCSPESLENAFTAGGNSDIIYGNMVHGGPEKVEHGLKKLRFFDFYVGSIFHQAAFIRRTLFDSVGIYNEDLKIVSDWEFFLKAIFLHQCSYRYVDVEIARYEPGGLSFQNQALNDKERAEVLDRYFPLFTADYAELKKFRYSDLSGIYRTMEKKGPLRFPLVMALKISRFIRFRLLRRPYGNS